MRTDLRVIEIYSGDCWVIGPETNRDTWPLRAPIWPSWGSATRHQAEKMVERMQQLESASLLA